MTLIAQRTFHGTGRDLEVADIDFRDATEAPPWRSEIPPFHKDTSQTEGERRIGDVSAGRSEEKGGPHDQHKRASDENPAVRRVRPLSSSIHPVQGSGPEDDDEQEERAWPLIPGLSRCFRELNLGKRLATDRAVVV